MYFVVNQSKCKVFCTKPSRSIYTITIIKESTKIMEKFHYFVENNIHGQHQNIPSGSLERWPARQFWMKQYTKVV